jgi:uncharacterized membrane protein
MSDVPRLLLGSLLLRPYVYAFFGLHLLGASALLGWPRTLAFTAVTWGVALLAEASSIRTGFPFGWYYYVPRTAGRELWILGVPFFDSLSFTFLLISSYGLAWLLLAGRRHRTPAGEAAADQPAHVRPTGWRHVLLAAGLFMLIDVVIDPVALRGDRWFLGHIYAYPKPGVYFGIPAANFLGWGVVGSVATALYHAWERTRQDAPPGRFCGRALLCPGLYGIVLGFNLAITLAIGEWRLGLCGVLLTLPILLRLRTILRSPRGLGCRPRGEGIRA